MHVTLSASGTPEHVTQAILSQARQARVSASHPALISALRDAVAQEISAHGDEQMTVTASVSVVVVMATPDPVVFVEQETEEQQDDE